MIGICSQLTGDELLVATRNIRTTYSSFLDENIERANTTSITTGHAVDFVHYQTTSLADPNARHRFSLKGGMCSVLAPTLFRSRKRISHGNIFSSEPCVQRGVVYVRSILTA
jgi:hypothetical protein